MPENRILEDTGAVREHDDDGGSVGGHKEVPRDGSEGWVQDQQGVHRLVQLTPQVIMVGPAGLEPATRGL